MALGDSLERLLQKRLQKIRERSMKKEQERQAKHALALELNQTRLRELRDKQRAALAGGDVPAGFPQQEIEPYRRHPTDLSHTASLAQRQDRVIENARKRREERRATLAARRRARYGLG